MSNPTPIGEPWMASTVEIMFMANPRNAHYAIADAHNAALTHERNNLALLKDEYEGVLKDFAKMEKQLAALDADTKIIMQLRKELAAERERTRQLEARLADMIRIFNAFQEKEGSKMRVDEIEGNRTSRDQLATTTKKSKKRLAVEFDSD